MFVVAATADINLRMASQLNRNVCYRCYDKMNICYNVCYSAAVADV